MKEYDRKRGMEGRRVRERGEREGWNESKEEGRERDGRRVRERGEGWKEGE